MKDDIFKEKVGIYSSKEIGRTAKERKAGSQGYAEAMLIAYNKKMKSPLKWSKLYVTATGAKGDDLYMDCSANRHDTYPEAAEAENL